MAASETISTGAPMFDRSALVRLILPMLFEQILSVTMGMADTLMVSGVGEAAVSSVSLVDSINVLIIQILSALATGGAVIGSQYLGRQDTGNARRSAAQLYTVLAFSTLAVMGVTLLFCRPILRIVFGQISEDVMRFAQTYLIISALSYPFIGAYNAGAALFRAQGNSRVSMLASLVMNIINITGNAILIYGFGMGVLGAALATLAGRIFAALWILHQQQSHDNPLRIGIPSGLENGMFQIGKLCVSSLTSTLGTSAIAANAVAGSINTLTNIPGSTMSLAMIPVVGRCLGAGEKQQAKRYAVRLLGIAMVGMAASSVVLYFGAPLFCRLFNLTAEATVMCEQVLRWFAVFSIFFWATSFTLPNALRAGGDAKFTMAVSMVSMWLFRVMLCYVFVQSFHMGLLGVWLGMFIDWICRSLLFLIRFVRGRWIEHQVI